MAEESRRLTNDEVAETLRGIKQQLHAMMNGPVSTAMRERGLNYKVNFGVELPRLQSFAETLPHTHDVAQALWKEDIRECRILAGMLQPADTFFEEIAEIWIDSMRFPEEAECTAMFLFSRLPYASDAAFRWIADARPMYQQCGYLLMSRLLMGGARMTARDEEEFLDQVSSALVAEPLAVKLAAHKSLLKYMDCGEAETAKGEALLEALPQEK